MASVSNNHKSGQDPGGGGGYSRVSAIYVFAAPKGRVCGPFWWSENTLSILVWNRVWFSRNLRERTCTNVFIVFNERNRNMRI